MAWVFNPFTGKLDWTAAGGGGTSGGSSGQVQYNNGGSFGGMSGTTWTDASQSLAIASTGAGTGVTTSSPVLNLSQTWNGSGVTFTGLKFNVTDTLSASGSLLLDIGTGGGTYVSKFSVTKGVTSVRFVKTTDVYPSFSGTNNSTALILGGSNTAFISQEGGFTSVITPGNNFSVIDEYKNCYAAIGVSGFGLGAAGTAPDLLLTRAAAATLRLGAADAAGKTASVTINFATNANNITWTTHGLTTGNAIQFSASVFPAATGGAIDGVTTYYVIVVDANTIRIARTYDTAVATVPTPVAFTSNGTSVVGRSSTPRQTFRVQSFTGTHIPGQPFVIQGSSGTGNQNGGPIIFQVAPAGSTGSAQNSYSTALTIASDRSAYFVGNVGAEGNVTLFGGVIQWSNSFVSITRDNTFGNGTLRLTAFADFNFISTNSAPIFRLGGTTSSFPALKRDTTTLQVRLADDTAYANLAAAQLYSPPTALTSGATISWNANTSSVASLTLDQVGATLTMSNLVAGGTYLLIITQGTGGSKTITTWTNFRWPGGTAPVLSTTAGAIDVITAYSDGTYLYGSAQIGFAS